MKKATRIFIVGPLPPPVHGMALVTAKVMARLVELGGRIVTVNLAANSLSRELCARFSRIKKIVFGLMKIAMQGALCRGDVLYIAISGRWGQIYDVLFVLLARFYGMRVYIHHHNILYMEKPSRLAGFLFKLAGPKSTHIVASDRIGLSLKAMYSCVQVIYPLSAIVVVDGLFVKCTRERWGVKNIGFIGNISEDKGVFDFIDLVGRLSDQKENISAIIAGPFQKKLVEKQVYEKLRKMPAIRYVGPVSGEDKKEFFDSIDVLVFPVRNEYEGIVIHESMSYGVPVIARESGCISDFVSSGVGQLIAANDNFSDVALKCISGWNERPNSINMMSLVARQQFYERWTENVTRLDGLCFAMMGASGFQFTSQETHQ